MSSMFEFDDRVRRLRETLAYLRDATMADADAIGGARQAPEDWSKFVGELRELLAAVEMAAPRRRVRSGQRSVVRSGVRRRPVAEAFRAGATLH